MTSPDPGATRLHRLRTAVASRLAALRAARGVATLRDPGIQAAIVLMLLTVAGFAMLGLAWRGGARTPYVPLQLPWLVSGGLAGLALLGMALGAGSIHLGRRDDAAHRAQVDDLVREAAALAEDLRTGRRQL